MNTISLTETIQKNYENVISNLHTAAKKANRQMEDVKLIAVSKRQPVEKIQAYILAGGKILGENYPEEGAEKKAILQAENIEWHMIGHIQSRKSQIAADNYDWIQTIDSVKIAEKLNTALSKTTKPLPVLIEINIAHEESKSGFIYDKSTIDSFWESIEIINNLEKIKVKGIMVMPPLTTLPEQARVYFAQARVILETINQNYPDLRLTELSMGTSQDYFFAIAEGATMVRVGTAIFGSRL